MGKTNESAQKRPRNNVRVDPATLSHFLCYYCGKHSSNRMDYQIHMLKVHEVLTQSYQLWSDHTMDELGLRWSETKGHSDREASCSLPSSPVSRECKVRNSEDDDEDYVCEDDKPSKRRKRDEERSKKSAGDRQRRQMSEKKKAEAAADRLKKAEEKRLEKAKRDEEKRQQEAAKRAMIQQQQADLMAARESEQKEGKRMSLMEMGEMEMQQRGVEPPEKKRSKKRPTQGPGTKPVSDPANDQQIADLVSSILSETKKKETSSQEVIEEDLTPEIIDRKPFDYTKAQTKYCKICKKGAHYTFDSLFEHYQDHHGAEITSFDYFGYKDKTLLGKRNLLERDHCPRCVMKFTRTRDYYTHMLQYHIHESVRCQVGFENANNADVEVKFRFRDRCLSLGYNFYFQNDAGLSTSQADIADYQAETVPVDIDQPSTSGPVYQQFFVERPIKQEPPMEHSESVEMEPQQY